MSEQTPTPEQQREIEQLSPEQRSVYEYVVHSLGGDVDDALDAAMIQHPSRESERRDAQRRARARRRESERRDGHFTATETTRRLRALAAEARRRCGLPARCRVEIGLRTSPVILDDPSTAPWYADDDDVSDQLDMRNAARHEDVNVHGAIVHLYFTTRIDGWDELSDICVGWMGTRTEPARLLDTNGTPIVRDDDDSSCCSGKLIHTADCPRNV